MKKYLPILIALFMMIPGTAYADNGDFVLGSKASKIYDSAPVVWYGGNSWHMIACDGKGAVSPEGKGNITLLSSGSLGNSVFNTGTYAGSTLQRMVDSLSGGSFTDTEKNAITPRTLKAGTYNDYDSFWDIDCVVGAAVEDALLWPLSVREAHNLNADLLSAGVSWWLRSPGKDDACKTFVNSDGSIPVGGSDISEAGVRPAFFLKQSSVLLASGVGSDEWKLTLLDSARSGFSASTVSDCISDDNTIEVRYSGAKTAGNEYITAIILDSDQNITSYMPQRITSSSGTVTIELDGINGSGDTVWIFNEQINTDHKSNYASEWRQITLPKGHDWDFVNFTWTGDGTNGYTAAVANYRCKTDSKHTRSLKASITEKVIAPTCTTPGKIVYTATVKGTDYRTETKECKVTKALGHNWGDWKTTKEPTETAKGEKQRICKNDSSHVEKQSIPVKEGGTKQDSETGSKPESEPETKTETKPETKTDTKTGTKAETDKIVSGVLLVRMTAKGKRSLKLTWTKVDGADGYEIFFGKCRKNEKAGYKSIKIINGNSTFSWRKKGLKAKTAYKAYVKAFVIKNGSRKYVGTSPDVHAFTSGRTKKYTNAKSVKVRKTRVTVGKGQTFRIKASIRKLKKKLKLMPKKHAPKLRYLSTDPSIASVSKKGKIKGLKAGTCYVYVFAHNGVSKKITVTVR